ncbi:uncharacterized protein LOC129590388 [Paramacrobiotus metropolitanus]|uniref:uncharacterized protein LOC129590388 n=1 Tax=Paramacrobiotus metropolitanus TaxID=2943436 RepID=UPI002445B48F|nr:uncharacterized protein LOC129590388 [Paramacrobiotus metropolitanus]
MESQKAKEAEASASGAGGLTYVDFVPKCLRPDSLLHWPEFEPFSTLIGPANAYLREHPHLTISGCETIHLQVEKDHIRNPDQSEFDLFGETAKPFVKALRIWLQPRDKNESHEAQQIGYVSFIPSVLPNVSQTLADLTKQANDWLHANPLPGRILSVETLLIRGVHGEINPDASAWKQKTSLAALTKQTFIQSFRIFYHTTPHPAHEDIGFVDFLPRMVESGGMFSFPRGEQFTDVLRALNQWVTSVPGNVRLLNIQTLLTRATRHGDPLNIYTACYTDAEFHEFHWRFLRLAFAAPRLEPSAPPVYALPTICSRLFVAGLTRDPKWYRRAELERLSVVRERLDRWVRGSGCRVLFVETVTYKTFTGNERAAGFDSMHTWNEYHYDSSSKSHRPQVEQYVVGFRVYFQGEVREVTGTTPARSLDDYRLENQDKCVIS